jgi:hypothetical protein
MLTKDEAPILRDVLEHNTKYIKDIYVLDGGSDNAEEIFQEFPEVKYYIHERDIKAKYGITEITDGIRHYLFEEIKKVAQPGDWVTIMHGDEIFYNDPNEVAALLSLHPQINMVKWWCPFFFPHTNDLAIWPELSSKKLQERFLYYSHNGTSAYWEARQFRIEEGMYYNIEHHSRVIPEGKDMHAPTIYPIFKHYKVWSVDPAMYELVENHPEFKLKMKDKWGQITFAPQSKEEFFVPCLPNFSHCNKFDGNFGILETPYQQFKAKMTAHLAPKGITINQLVNSLFKSQLSQCLS